MLASASALLFSTAIAAPAAAEPLSRTPDPVVVELYREARELVNAGRWDEACPKFEQAMAKQPTASILINIGDCHAHQGKLAKAMEDYDIARELNRDTQEEARRVALTSEIEMRAKKLAPRIPALRVLVENPITDMIVRLDGEALDPDKIGIDIPTDPGAHVVTVEAAGYEAPPSHVTLKEGARERVTMRLLPRPFAVQHRASIVLGATAIALAGAGAGLAGWTTTTHASLSEACNPNPGPACDGQKRDVLAGTIATTATFATAGTVAIAAVLVFTIAERPKAPKVQVAFTGTSATLGASW